MSDIILKDESYELIGICMEIHREPEWDLKKLCTRMLLNMNLKKRKSGL